MAPLRQKRRIRNSQNATSALDEPTMHMAKRRVLERIIRNKPSLTQSTSKAMSESFEAGETNKVSSSDNELEEEEEDAKEYTGSSVTNDNPALDIISDKSDQESDSNSTDSSSLSADDSADNTSATTLDDDSEDETPMYPPQLSQAALEASFTNTLSRLNVRR
ncbi:hypothetical protein IWQ61_009025, partial [Dispira simplex]